MKYWFFSLVFVSFCDLFFCTWELSRPCAWLCSYSAYIFLRLETLIRGFRSQSAGFRFSFSKYLWGWLSINRLISQLVLPPVWYVGVLQHQQFSHTNGHPIAITIVLMHSGIVNGYKLLCDAHTVPEQHRGSVALFLFHSFLPVSAISFMCLSLWQCFFFSGLPQ